jgi:hypothetical protein
METQYIVGKLTPTRPEAIKKRTYRYIYDAVTNNNLYGIVFSSNWEEGILHLDNHTPNVPAEECPSALEFITRLNKLLQAKGVKELGLKGEITVIVPSANPVIFKLIIADGNIYHWQAGLHWDDHVTIM